MRGEPLFPDYDYPIASARSLRTSQWAPSPTGDLSFSHNKVTACMHTVHSVPVQPPAPVRPRNLSNVSFYPPGSVGSVVHSETTIISYGK